MSPPPPTGGLATPGRRVALGQPVEPRNQRCREVARAEAAAAAATTTTTTKAQRMRSRAQKCERCEFGRQVQDKSAASSGALNGFEDSSLSQLHRLSRTNPLRASKSATSWPIQTSPPADNKWLYILCCIFAKLKSKQRQDGM